ncbi:MAG: hypothetical protein R3270_09720, partial [Gammaproteobacteria bacterium]|nr:hypothetical protein [Gammaproteobacteria bacterium]
MKRLLMLAPLAALLAGCATTDCDYLAYETAPTQADRLKMPNDVREPTPSGEFRLPDVEGAIAEDCMANPPQTLTPEMIDGEIEEEG